ncbi:MAG TPA: 3-methyl-2-oxobutanoate hydroxymethyltransferase [Armatimonadota bacterium]|nr:3-methyl-2-oxobutanoate hydroxymethyltransferase [Armatimonadota bacterium]
MSDRITTRDLRGRKGGKPIAALTAYDVSFARLFDRAGMDILLVGDSLAEMMLGYKNTIPVTMDEMLSLAAAVVRGSERAFVVADLPFLSYQASSSDAVRNAGRFLKEAGVQAVKLEGGGPVVETVRSLTSAGIPVMGHLGLQPQSEHQIGGRRHVAARTADAAQVLIQEARQLEDAGVFSLVLEKVPWQVAQRVTAAIAAPTIGIGAGPYCDGQVLIMHDLLGLGDHLKARFCPAYADLNAVITEAVARWTMDVAERRFPDLEQSFGMKEDELEKLGGNYSGAG